VGSGCSARAKIQDLKFIRKSQELGFSLNEIRELLIVLDESVPSCTHVRELLERKLTTVRGKIEELQKLEGSLKSALRKCARKTKTSSTDHAACCPVLDELARAAGERKRKSRSYTSTSTAVQTTNQRSSWFVRCCGVDGSAEVAEMTFPTQPPRQPRASLDLRQFASTGWMSNPPPAPHANTR